MAIRTYLKDNQKLYEVYVNGVDSRGMRIQRKRREIETLRKAETIEFELKRELTKLMDHPSLGERELSEIKRTDVYQIIFEAMEDKTSLHNRKTILKMVRRIFQMAVEDGHLDRNPGTGIQVKVPETAQKVLTFD